MKMTDEELTAWNTVHPEGSPCWLHVGDAKKINLWETKTRSQAWRLGDGSVVVLVKGKTGGWEVERVVFGTFLEAANELLCRKFGVEKNFFAPATCPHCGKGLATPVEAP